MKRMSLDDAALSVDIGGTHITAGVVDITTRRVRAGSIIRKAIDPHGSASDIIDTWSSVIQAVRQANIDHDFHLLVSMPGPFDYAGGISLITGLGKYEALYGMNIREEFAARTGIIREKIFFMNDAEAFLRGEIDQKYGVTDASILGLTLGTGLGAALAQGGIVKDINLGSSPFHGGIAEDYISSRGIIVHYRRLGGTGVHDVKRLVSLLPHDIEAAATMQQLSEWLADFLLVHVPRLDIDRVIFGGNISISHQFFLPELVRLMKDNDVPVKIVVAEMGEEAAMVGVTSMVKFTH